MVTIIDIADRLNISKSTVSRALTGSSGVSEKTRELVLNTAKEMNYSANVYARNLAGDSTHMIYFMIPDITDAFYQEMANSADKVLSDAGYRVFYRNVRRSTNEVMNFLSEAKEFKMDGIFITVDEWTDEVCDAIKKMDIPVISLRRKTPEKLKNIVPYVDSDFIDGTEKAVKYLISLNHINIGYVGYETLVGKERISAYERSCEKHNIEKNIIRNRAYQNQNVRIEVGYDSAKKLLSESPEITAIMAGDDQLAIGVMKFCSEEGLRVPEDISVIGCDDRNISSLYCLQLTTIRQERTEAGSLAGELMLDMISKPGVYESINVPMTIKERKTVGKARK